MKICVIGSGYVGLSLALLIARYHEVTILDISKERIKQINKKISPIKDTEIENYLSNHNTRLLATHKKEEAYKNADFVIIATPTNYNSKTGSFDTRTVKKVISECLSHNLSSTIVIKSTIPLGFTDKMKKKFKTNNIFFSPEFLRESKALYDNLYPSRIVIGDYSEQAIKFGNILNKCAKKKQIPIFFMSSREAEAVKLFSNTFLAMRISYFNELDSFAETENLSSRNIVQGISADPRIGNYYNNPSFGYGGYCLPKDTKQLLNNFKRIPNNIITATVEANKTRKKFIIKSILNKRPKTVGIYRLIMKKGSDNFRDSAILDILSGLKKKKIRIILYEPYISEKKYDNIPIIKELNLFKKKSDLIIANRYSSELKNVENKVYTRDLFEEN